MATSIYKYYIYVVSLHVDMQIVIILLRYNLLINQLKNGMNQQLPPSGMERNGIQFEASLFL